MSEFSRAFGLMDRLDELTAERLEPTPFGPVIVHSRLNRVHDLNFLRAEKPGGANAEELAAEAERVQGAAGIAHRRVNIRDEAQRERLEPQFVRLGWKPERFVLMVLRGEPDRPAEHEVLEIDEPTMRPLWAEAIRAEPHGKDETLVQQILEHRRNGVERFPTRLFSAEADGRLVAHAELYSKDGVGQVENVVTLPDYRGRGLARGLVLHACAESRADRHRDVQLRPERDVRRPVPQRAAGLGVGCLPAAVAGAGQPVPPVPPRPAVLGDRERGGGADARVDVPLSLGPRRQRRLRGAEAGR